MEIVLELNGICIETAAKKKYEELVRELIKKDDEKLENELQTLIDFLKSADFAKLRAAGFDGREYLKVKIVKKERGFEIVKV